MAASSVFLCFLSLLLLLLLLPVVLSSTVTLSLTPTTHSLSHTAQQSTLLRAHHLKHHPHSPRFHPRTTHSTPIYPKSYGGYSVTLSFGTPPQKLPLVFDTGSSLLWLPCTASYTCLNCTFSQSGTNKTSAFKLRRSSTFRVVGCRNPKCGWLYGSDVRSRCSGTGSAHACPSYLMQYGLGSTSGRPITDNLDLPGNIVVPGFFLGCSILSDQQPQSAGIAGFGRAPTSLPNQLRLRKFSYCLLSHDLDDKPKSSELILVGPRKSKLSGTPKVHGVSYTPLLKNPTGSPYDEYYYIHLKGITVGKNKTWVKLPTKYLKPSRAGNGGTIIDSGSTFSFMEHTLLQPLIHTMAAQITHYKRSNDSEAQSGFGLCYNVSDSKNVSFPELVFHFQGGAKVELGVANYFSFFTDLGVWCLTIMSDSSTAGPGPPVGPVVILGNYQQQDFYIEYDLKHQRLGFKKQKCG